MSNDKSYLARKFSDLTESTTTKAVKKGIEDALSKDAVCFDVAKKHTITQSVASDLTKFSEQLKLQNQTDGLSAKVDWLNPQKYSSYQLIKNPLPEYTIQSGFPIDPTDVSQYIPNKLYCIDKGNGKLEYKIGDLEHKKIITNEILLGGIKSLPASPITNQTLDAALPEILKHTNLNGDTRDLSKAYLSLETTGDQISYTINTPDWLVQKGSMQLPSCNLIKLSKNYVQIGASYSVIKHEVKEQDAVLLTGDNKLLFVDSKTKSVILLKETEANRVDFNILMKKIKAQAAGALMPSDAPARVLIEKVTAEGTNKGRTFLIDDVKALLAQENPVYDERLAPIFTEIVAHVTQRTLTLAQYPSLISNSTDPTDKEFIAMIHPVQHPIQEVLSHAEFIRYHAAYRTIFEGYQNANADVNTIIEPAKKMFEQEMKTRIYTKTYEDLVQKIKELETNQKIPLETAKLMRTLIKHHQQPYSTSLYGRVFQDEQTRLAAPGATLDDKIEFLRTASQFLETSWCQGTAITNYAEQKPLSAAQQSMNPYVKTEVVKPVALPIDEQMPEYAKYKIIFRRIQPDVDQYNVKAELQQTKKELQTKFYAPVNPEQFSRVALKCRNCFVWYGNELYYINSNRLKKKIPITIGAVTGDAMTVNELNIPFTNAQLKLKGKLSLTPAKQYDQAFTDYLKKNSLPKATYDLLPAADQRKHLTAFEGEYYGEFGRAFNYSDAEMRSALGKAFPTNTSNLKLANKLMTRARVGTSILDYKASVQKIVPFGNIASYVNKNSMYRLGTSSGKLSSPLGKADSQAKYLNAVAAERATWGSLFSDSQRLPAIKAARLIGQGDLCLNQNMLSEPCGLIRLSAKVNSSGMNQYLATLKFSTWLITTEDKNKVYFVDKSGPEPVVTAVENKDLFENLAHVLESVETPINVSAEDKWRLFGYQHALPGSCAVVSSKQAVDKAKVNCKNYVETNNAVLIVTDDPDDTHFSIGFLDANNQYQRKECEKKDYKFITSFDIAVQKGTFTQSDDIKIINEFLKTQNSRSYIPHREQAISHMSKELSDAIMQEAAIIPTHLKAYFGYETASTRAAKEDEGTLASMKAGIVHAVSSTIPGPKSSVYESFIEQYQFNEAANRLDATLTERQQLQKRFNDAFEPVKKAIENCTTKAFRTYVVEEAPKFDASKKDNHYMMFDAKTDQFIVYKLHDPAKDLSVVDCYRVPYHTIATDYGIDASTVNKPSLKTIYKDLVKEYYDIELKGEADLAKLQYWQVHQKGRGKPPFELKPGVIYLFQNPKTRQFHAAAINSRGDLILTDDVISPEHVVYWRGKPKPREVILDNILPQLMSQGLVSKPALVSSRFLQRCDEVRAFLQQANDEDLGYSIAPVDLVSREQRLRMVNMMQVCAEDPTSEAAQHYLRDHHQLYFCVSESDFNHIKTGGFKNYEANSFVLISDPSNKKQKPILYYLDEGKRPQRVWLKSMLMTTPEKKLLAKRVPAGCESVSLSSAEVYDLITSHSYYQVAAIPSAGDIEPGVLYIGDGSHDGVYYKVSRHGAVVEGIIPNAYLPTQASGYFGTAPMTAHDIIASYQSGKPEPFHTLLQYTAKQGHTTTGELKMDTAQELLEEIKAEELSLWKALENFVFGMLFLGIGCASILLCVAPLPVIASIPILGLFVGGNLVISSILTVGFTLAGLACFKACITGNEWFQPGVSRLQEKLKDLEIQKLALADAKVIKPPPPSRPPPPPPGSSSAVVKR